MKYLSLTLSLWLSSTTLAWAGDAATLHFLGFSNDGKHLAFEQFGIADGVGAPYAELHLVDVSKNTHLAAPLKQLPNAENPATEQADTLEAATDTVRQANLKAAQEMLTKFQLQHTQTGEQLVHHLLTDLSVNPFTVHFSPQLPLAGQAYDEFILHLQEQTVDAKDCIGSGKAKIFSLSLRKKDEKPEQAKILQADQNLPNSRGCPTGYRIAEVYLYQEQYLAVFIQLLVPGFEGENLRYLVVTGILPHAEGQEQMSDAARDKREAILQKAIDPLEQKKTAAGAQP